MLDMSSKTAAHVTDRDPAWVRAHGDVLDVARDRAKLERREGTCMLRAFREGVHRHLGYGAFAEYADRHLGHGHRTTQDKLRTAEALERLPELARALAEGHLHASAVRELARVATPDTETAWIDAAAGRRVREIEHLVAGRARGDHPRDTPHPELTRHILRFEVRGETLAAFREAMTHVRQQSGEALEDDAALLLIARSVLCNAAQGAAPNTHDDDPTASPNLPTPNTPRDAVIQKPRPGRPRYQINVTVCERCQNGYQHAGADLIPIAPAMLEAAHCDAQVRNDTPLDIDTHVGAKAQPPRPRATTPPAVRRRVLERDHHRCQIPGCRHTLDIDVHHIKPRAEAGSHDPANLITLCSAHHRAVHAGRLHISGTAPHALHTSHAEGTPYGAPPDTPDARRSDLAEKVFRGLRWLGFKETEAKRALTRALHEHPDATQPPTAEALLKRALELAAPCASTQA